MRRKSARRKRSILEPDQEEELESANVVKKTRTTTTTTIPVKVKAEDEDEELEGLSNGSLISKVDIKKKVDEFIQNNDEKGLREYFKELEGDPRVSIATLIFKTKTLLERQKAEQERLEIMMEYERSIIDSFKKQDNKAKEKNTKNKYYLIGVDEVGVGPLAGPIVSCAVAFEYSILENNLNKFIGIDDSKKLTLLKRENLEKVIKQFLSFYSFGIVSAKQVDEINPLQGSFLAMKKAVESLNLPKQSLVTLLVDHHTIPNLQDTTINQVSITKGDSKSIVIAAASILAKVYRDRYMSRLHQQYPNFAFDKNAGYGTKEHLIQLQKGNLCPEHRLSYEPVRLAHRKSIGLPPDASPKKTKSRSNSPRKSQIEPLKKTKIGGAATPPTISDSSAAPPPPPPSNMFSLGWWMSWMPSFAPSQTP